MGGTLKHQNETPQRDQKERNRWTVTNVKACQVMQVCTLVSFAGRMSAVARGAPLACAQGSLCQLAAIAVRQSQSPVPLFVCIWNVLRKKPKTIGISLQWPSAPIALTKRLLRLHLFCLSPSLSFNLKPTTAFCSVPRWANKPTSLMAHPLPALYICLLATNEPAKIAHFVKHRCTPGNNYENILKILTMSMRPEKCK